jgi:hypothetical protein
MLKITRTIGVLLIMGSVALFFARLQREESDNLFESKIEQSHQMLNILGKTQSLLFSLKHDSSASNWNKIKPVLIEEFNDGIKNIDPEGPGDKGLYSDTVNTLISDVDAQYKLIANNYPKEEIWHILKINTTLKAYYTKSTAEQYLHLMARQRQNTTLSIISIMLMLAGVLMLVSLLKRD